MTDNAELNDALASNFMLVRVSFRAWGGERINHTITDEVVESKQATRDAGKFSMKLLASADDELKVVRAQMVALRSFVYNRTLPWTLNSEGAKKGDRLIATGESLQFLADTAKMKKGYDDSILELQRVWDTRVAQAKANLGQMGAAIDPSVYPTASQVPSLFAVSIELHPLPTITDFSRLTIPAGLADALGQRLANQTRVQVENAMTDLRDRLAKELSRMASNLAKAGAGEKTKLYESMLTNTHELCLLARSMNLTRSPRFDEIVDRIEASLLRYPIATLREDVQTAALVAKEAAEVRQELETVDWF